MWQKTEDRRQQRSPYEALRNTGQPALSCETRDGALLASVPCFVPQYRLTTKIYKKQGGWVWQKTEGRGQQRSPYEALRNTGRSALNMRNAGWHIVSQCSVLRSSTQADYKNI